jgi:hypothetical protein
MILGVVVFPYIATDDTTGSSIGCTRCGDGVFMIIPFGMGRKDMFSILKHDAIAWIGKGSSALD